MSRPWMPLYVGDYLGDTRRLTTLQHGAYMLLIMEYWQNGGIPDDDEELAQIAGLSAPEWKAMRPKIAALFLPGWKHKRIDAEIAKANEKSTKAKDSASKRWQSNGNANAMPTQCEGNAKAYADAMLLHPQPQEDTLSSAREPTDAENYGQAITETYSRAGKATPDLNPSIRWRKAGWPIEIVCEVIRAKLAANPSKSFSLTYFENPISEAVARQSAPVPIAAANPRAGPSAKPPSVATKILQASRNPESFSNVPSRQTNTRLIDAVPIARESR